ncbi:kinase-like domain-containing protein [Rhizophagus irregularis DAOM 181602=DAOM 197198]|nr:kinase-like domain-containing protein [Rhizophagus irregularis DAOM 181602=DAOM 197198]
MEVPVDFGNLTTGKKIIAENFANWTSGNEIIDNFIREKQLKYGDVEDNSDDGEAVFEWIPYNELIDIKEIENNCFTKAKLKNGSLHYNRYNKEWIRRPYETVILRSLYDLQNVITEEFANKLESYLTYPVECYGVSQNPDTRVYILVFDNKISNHYCKTCGNEYEGRRYKWCKQCQIDQIKNNFTNWDDRIIKLDDFIQNMQLIINNYNVFKWIPYNEFIIVKELGNYTLAMWKKDRKVYLKHQHNLQENTDEFLNMLGSSVTSKIVIGISQNPNTKLENYTLAIWKKGPLYSNYVEKSERNSCVKVYLRNLREITDEVLNEVESYLINKVIFGISQNPDTKVYLLVFHIIYFDRIFEWIPYNEFIISNESENCTLAIWEQDVINSVRKSYEKVYLKHLEITDEFLNKIESYLNNKCLVFGISQNPNTKVYVLVLDDKFFDYYCEKCDNKYKDGYELGKHSTLAIWEKGSLYPIKNEKLIRNSHEKVYLKYMNNSQEITDEFLNKVESFLLNNLVSGISQNPDTKDYILVFNNYYIAHYCLKCENKYDENAYNYWSIWKYGPLYYSKIRKNYKRESDEKVLLKYLNNSQNINHTFLNEILYSVEERYGLSLDYKWKRESNTKVALKCLHNSQNFLDEFINEVKAYPNQKIDNILKIYGISQNPTTKDYIMVLEYAEGGDFNSYLNKNTVEIIDFTT